MGFLGKKKNPSATSSVLSESEIQKKLYGEFSDGTSPVVIGDRELLKEPAPAPVPPKESAPKKEEALDLFSEQRDVVPEPQTFSRQASLEQKPAEHASRYVPLRDFEKKSVPPAPASSPADPASRFRYKRPRQNQLALLQELLKKLTEQTGELFRFIMDPKQVAIRRVFYWVLAVLVVFFLFWGVNALNSQREEAMRVRYKIPGATVSENAASVAAAVIPPKPVAERPVVITPAPVRVPKAATLVAEPYVIQVVTYPSAQDADSIVKVLKGAGFRAFTKESARPSGRVFYMVLIGGFRTAAEAQSQLAKFRGHEVARPFQDAFVRTNRA